MPRFPLKPQPTFEQFKKHFWAALVAVKGDVAYSERDRWLAIGNREEREKILSTLKVMLEEEYGVELVLKSGLVEEDTLVESIIVRLHHVFSSVYIMERINARILARRSGW